MSQAALSRTDPAKLSLTHANFSERHRAPLVIRLANRVLGVFPRPALTAGQLIDSARKQTGLSDLGHEFFVPALEQLLRSMHEEANLSPVGRLIQKKRLTDLLVNRLHLQREFSARPELADAELLPPVLIAGLQRTGTTLLHRLLASHPDCRSLASWEVLNPGPRPGDTDDGKRKALARQAEGGLRFIAPEFFAIHPVEAMAPEEEVLLLELSFMSQTGEAIMNVPSYSSWLEKQDQLPAYEYMVRVLKLFQAKTPAAKHWVLKSPNHLEWLDVVLQAMPGVTIVQTHRNPLATVASFCSMVSHGRAVFSDSVDARAVGQHWLRKLERMVTRAMTVREQCEPAFTDLSYSALVAEPAQELRKLHERLAFRAGEDVGLALSAELAHSRKDRFGQHRYQLEDFGLDEAQVRSALGSYMKAHDY